MQHLPSLPLSVLERCAGCCFVLKQCALCLAFRDLGRLLRVNVMGYDYSGYGVCSSPAGPSVTATCGDIAAVLDALETIHGVKRKDVVLYGQSVGSGPTVSLLSSTRTAQGQLRDSTSIEAQQQAVNQQLVCWCQYPQWILCMHAATAVCWCCSTASAAGQTNTKEAAAKVAAAHPWGNGAKAKRHDGLGHLTLTIVFRCSASAADVPTPA